MANQERKPEERRPVLGRALKHQNEKEHHNMTQPNTTQHTTCSPLLQKHNPPPSMPDSTGLSKAPGFHRRRSIDGSPRSVDFLDQEDGNPNKSGVHSILLEPSANLMRIFEKPRCPNRKACDAKPQFGRSACRGRRRVLERRPALDRARNW